MSEPPREPRPRLADPPILIGFILAVLGLGFNSFQLSRELQRVAHTRTGQGFDAGREAQIKGAIGNLFTPKCADAYHNAHLRSPEEVVKHDGLVVRPGYYLLDYTKEQLQILRDDYYNATREEFKPHANRSSQGGTIPAVDEDGGKITADGRTQIYLHTYWAFRGESFWDRTFSFQDVMSHEFIHANPTPQVPGLFGPLRHDLAGFGPHDAILAACR